MPADHHAMIVNDGPLQPRSFVILLTLSGTVICRELPLGHIRWATQLPGVHGVWVDERAAQPVRQQTPSAWMATCSLARSYTRRRSACVMQQTYQNVQTVRECDGTYEDTDEEHEEESCVQWFCAPDWQPHRGSTRQYNKHDNDGDTYNHYCTETDTSRPNGVEAKSYDSRMVWQPLKSCVHAWNSHRPLTKRLYTLHSCEDRVVILSLYSGRCVEQIHAHPNNGCNDSHDNNTNNINEIDGGTNCGSTGHSGRTEVRGSVPDHDARLVVCVREHRYRLLTPGTQAGISLVHTTARLVSVEYAAFHSPSHRSIHDASSSSDKNNSYATNHDVASSDYISIGATDVMCYVDGSVMVKDQTRTCLSDAFVDKTPPTVPESVVVAAYHVAMQPLKKQRCDVHLTPHAALHEQERFVVGCGYEQYGWAVKCGPTELRSTSSDGLPSGPAMRVFVLTGESVKKCQRVSTNSCTHSCESVSYPVAMRSTDVTHAIGAIDSSHMDRSDEGTDCSAHPSVCDDTHSSHADDERAALSVAVVSPALARPACVEFVSFFDNNFEPLRVLGKGAGGAVLLVQHRYTGALYAMKVLVARDYRSEHEILREMRVHAVLSNRHLVRYHVCWSEVITQSRAQQLAMIGLCSARAAGISRAMGLVTAASEENLYEYDFDEIDEDNDSENENDEEEDRGKLHARGRNGVPNRNFQYMRQLVRSSSSSSSSVGVADETVFPDGIDTMCDDRHDSVPRVTMPYSTTTVTRAVATTANGSTTCSMLANHPCEHDVDARHSSSRSPDARREHSSCRGNSTGTHPDANADCSGMDSHACVPCAKYSKKDHADRCERIACTAQEHEDMKRVVTDEEVCTCGRSARSRRVIREPEHMNVQHGTSSDTGVITDTDGDSPCADEDEDDTLARSISSIMSPASRQHVTRAIESCGVSRDTNEKPARMSSSGRKKSSDLAIYSDGCSTHRQHNRHDLFDSTDLSSNKQENAFEMDERIRAHSSSAPRPRRADYDSSDALGGVDDRERSILGARVVFLQMELCQRTLKQHLESRTQVDRVENMIIALQLIEAVRYMHHVHVLHRDIKSTNVFLSYQCQLLPCEACDSEADSIPGDGHDAQDNNRHDCHATEENEVRNDEAEEGFVRPSGDDSVIEIDATGAATADVTGADAAQPGLLLLRRMKAQSPECCTSSFAFALPLNKLVGGNDSDDAEALSSDNKDCSDSSSYSSRGEESSSTTRSCISTTAISVPATSPSVARRRYAGATSSMHAVDVLMKEMTAEAIDTIMSASPLYSAADVLREGKTRLARVVLPRRAPYMVKTHSHKAYPAQSNTEETNNSNLSRTMSDTEAAFLCRWAQRRLVQVKLGDFGLARLLQPPPSDSNDGCGVSFAATYDSRLAHRCTTSHRCQSRPPMATGTVSPVNTVGVGTPLYASPEQLRGDVCTGASDVFSLGVLFAEMYARPATMSERIEQLNAIRSSTFPTSGMLAQYPELSVVRELTHPDPRKRMSLSKARAHIQTELLKCIKTLEL